METVIYNYQLTDGYDVINAETAYFFDKEDLDIYLAKEHPTWVGNKDCILNEACLITK